jgi:hypothetical protein
MFGLIIIFQEHQPPPRTEKADRKVVLDADQGKGTTRMDIEHSLRKGNPKSSIAEGNYSLGMADARVGNDGCDVCRSRPRMVGRHDSGIG